MKNIYLSVSFLFLITIMAHPVMSQKKMFLSTNLGPALVEGQLGSSMDVQTGWLVDNFSFFVHAGKYTTLFDENPVASFDKSSHISITEGSLDNYEGFYHENSQISQNLVGAGFNYHFINNADWLAGVGLIFTYFWHTELDIRINGLSTPQLTYTHKMVRDWGWNTELKLMRSLNDTFYLGTKLRLESIVDYNVGFLVSLEARI